MEAAIQAWQTALRKKEVVMLDRSALYPPKISELIDAGAPAPVPVVFKGLVPGIFLEW